MIQCNKCQNMNSSELSVCAQCGADLLPGVSASQRQGAIVVGIVLVLLGIGSLFFARALIVSLIEDQSGFWRPTGYGVLMMVLVAGGIFYLAFNRFKFSMATSSPDEKYFYRAKRHIGIDNTQAETDFKEAIRLVPRGGSIGFPPRLKELVYHQERAMFYEKTDRLDLAISDYGRVINLHSDYPLYYYQRGLLHEKHLDPKKAETDFTSALELMSKNSSTWQSMKPVGIPEVKAAIKRVSST